MSVDGDEVRRIADLAKLSLADDEVDRLADEMSRILDHARRLREVESEGEVASAPGDASSPDSSRTAAEPSPLERDPLLHTPRSIAPDMREGFFVVPPPPGIVDADDADAAREDV